MSLILVMNHCIHCMNQDFTAFFFSQKNKEKMATFAKECQEVFDTTDLYKILELPKTAPQTAGNPFPSLNYLKCIMDLYWPVNLFILHFIS